MTTRKKNTPRAAGQEWTPGPARYLLALALLFLMSSDSLAGQESGDIVRVSGNLTAEFIRSDSTGLYLSSGFVPYADITSLELKVGTRSRWREGMLIGGIIGAATGSVLAKIACGDWNDGSDLIGCLVTVALLAPLTTLAGSVVGTLVGATQRADRFAPILLPTSGVGMSKRAGGRFGLTLGVQLRF